MSLESVSNLGVGDKRLQEVLAELQGLTVSFVDGAGSNSLVAVTGMETEDTIKSIINLTDLAALDLANVTIVDRRASATVTILSTVVDGDTVTVNGKVYTFKEVDVTPSYNIPPYVVPITVDASNGCDTDEAAANLAAAIMSGDSSLTCEAASAVVTITARTAGTAGNDITLTDSGAHTTCSGATLSGGVAATGCGFKSTDSSSSKKLLVIWFNKQ